MELAGAFEAVAGRGVEPATVPRASLTCGVVSPVFVGAFEEGFRGRLLPPVRAAEGGPDQGLGVFFFALTILGRARCFFLEAIAAFGWSLPLRRGDLVQPPFVGFGVCFCLFYAEIIGNSSCVVVWCGVVVSWCNMDLRRFLLALRGKLCYNREVNIRKRHDQAVRNLDGYLVCVLVPRYDVECGK